MRHARSLGSALGWSCFCWLSAFGHAQEKRALPDPSRPQPVTVRAAETLRNEAEADIKQPENDFTRLKARLLLMAPAAAPPAAVRVRRRDPVRVDKLVRVSVNPLGVVLQYTQLSADREVQEDDVPAAPRYLVDSETFDMNAYSSTGNARSASEHLMKLLHKKVREIALQGPLTSTEEGKLLLAGRGDIKRLLDSIEEKRATFEGLRTDLDECEEFLGQLVPLRQLVRRGPFGNGSLFEKTLKKLRDEKNLVRR